MKIKTLVYTVSSLFLLSICVDPAAARESVQPERERPNVVFIVIDDMNDWTTLYDPDYPIRTPNLEALAERGVFFSRAYATAPACNPSRVSVMTGTYPHKTGVYGNRSDWRRALPEKKTVQQYFGERGYYVGGSGKIFHHHLNWALHDNDSFHEFLLMKINEPYPPEKLNGLEWYGTRNTDWGAWPPRIEETPDFKTAEYARRFLEREHEAPFFLNVGIYKPHSPFFAPQEFIDLYPLESLQMPEVRREGWEYSSGAEQLLARAAWFWRGMKRALEENPLAHREFVQAYMAASTFADAMLGRVIGALDESPYRDNTIVVVWSDHGFHIGEKEHIEKFALWEKTTRVPLIVVAPGLTSPGTVVDRPVDLTALYPTLIDLAGLEPVNSLHGHSLKPLFSDPTAEFPPALMTRSEGNHAIRKDEWRYIEYADGSFELYNLGDDPYEWRNLAGDPNHSEIIEELRGFIPEESIERISDYRRF